MELEEYPVKAVMDLSCVFHRMIEKQMADLGLSSIQSRMLGYLYFQSCRGKKVFQRELEKEFKIRKSSVTSVLQILEKKGLVQRASVRGDARQKELLLTGQGAALQNTVLRRLDALEQRISDSMDTEERKQFFLCIRKMETFIKEAEYD